MAGGRWQEADGRRQMAGGRWQEADGRRQMAGGRWQEADGRRGEDLTCFFFIHNGWRLPAPGALLTKKIKVKEKCTFRYFF